MPLLEAGDLEVLSVHAELSGGGIELLLLTGAAELPLLLALAELVGCLAEGLLELLAVLGEVGLTALTACNNA